MTLSPTNIIQGKFIFEQFMLDKKDSLVAEKLKF